MSGAGFSFAFAASAAAALVFLLVVAAGAALVRGAGHRGRIRGALALTLGVFTLAFGTLSGVANEHRGVGPDDAERRGDDREAFVTAGRIGLAGVFVLTLAVAVASGSRAAGRRGAAVVVAAVAVFLAASFRPVVEYVNACEFGEPLFWPRAISCG